MIHIAICDDEKNFVAHLQELLNQYTTETGEEIKVSIYYDGLELIEKYDTTIDLIFLDIQMKHVNGLKTAERIRQIDTKVGIIFLTTLTQYGLEGYKYQALYAWRLRFDFPDESGLLGYLNGREVRLDPADIWFLKDFD